MKNEINEIKLGNSNAPKDYSSCYSFEYLDNGYKLIFPYLYTNIMSNKKISDEEIKNSNKCILKKFGNEGKIKDFIIPLLNINNIPENILAKFWGKIYTLTTSFYKNLNWSLMKLENEEYMNSYIQALYSGLKEFQFKEKKMLYRGTNISEKEVKTIIEFYENKEINKKKFGPSYLIYSRGFLSFSKDESIAKTFIGTIKGTKKILFRLNYFLENERLSNADLKEITDISAENEVLFFPFSSFIITSITIKNDIYYIDLEYLGIYKDEINKRIEEVNNNPNDPELFNKVIRTSFAKDCYQSQIISNKNDNNNNENVNNNQLNIINNIYKYNNYFISNEINAIYMKNEKTINILHNYNLENDVINEIKESYLEAKKDINSENIEIFINKKKKKFDFYYTSNEIGEIEVKFKFKKLLKNTSYLFYNCPSLKTIDLSSFKTDNITSMISMFENCHSLESIDLVSFNTTNVQNMSCMFKTCSSLKNINLSLFETSKVTDISYMFMDCSSLKSMDLSSFNTTNAKNMSHIFESCSSLEKLDISSFKTTEHTNVWNMFEGCSSLRKENVKMDANDQNILKEISYLT